MEKRIVALVLKLYQEGKLFTSDDVTVIRVSDDFKNMLKQILGEK